MPAAVVVGFGSSPCAPKAGRHLPSSTSVVVGDPAMPEDKSYSLVSLGDLSKPADTLIKKVSKAVGGIFAPYQIKRIAKAEAQAALIKEQTEIQITDMHRRAIRRFVEEEAQRQQNIEDITARALPQLAEGARPDSMEDDWVTNFFDKCRIISDAEMQTLWSRVLAGEANVPGTYSKRTVNFLSDLDKFDAESFSALCRFCWSFSGPVPVVFNVESDIYARHGVTFPSLTHLDSIGLVQFNSVVRFQITGLPKEVTVHYYGRPLTLHMPNETNNQLEIGHTVLTKVGEELAAISGSSPVEGFWDSVAAQWARYLPKEGTEAGSAPTADPPAGPPASGA